MTPHLCELPSITSTSRFLAGDTITPEEGLEAARWIVSRQWDKGSYRGMPAPTPEDFEQGIRVFTGEKLLSASARHIMGQEAARAAWLLGRTDPAVRSAYDQATGWMHETSDFQQKGTFCCGRCTLAFWRHTWVGDFDNKEANIVKGLHLMNGMRIGDGKWRSLPFFYAVYTLSEIELEPARAELRYAIPVMERYIRHPRQDDYSKRRVTIFTTVLEKLN